MISNVFHAIFVVCFSTFVVITQAQTNPDPRCDVKYGFTSDPTNCNAYLLCMNNVVMQEVTCPQGKMFDNTTKLCKDAHLVTCGSRVLDTSGTGTQDLPDPRCDVKNGFTSDPTNCNVYLICTNNVVIQEITCPEGTMFDNSTKLCRRADLVTCGSRALDTSQDSALPDPRCDVKTGFTSDPTNCSVYLVCSDNVVTREIMCPEGTLYDNKTKRCTRADLVTCGSRALDTTGTQGLSDPRCDIKSGFTSDPTNCQAYLLCINNVVMQEVTCPEGTMFDNSTKLCKRAELVTCGSRVLDTSQVQNVPEEPRCDVANGFSAHPTQCNVFLLCSNYEIAREITCPGETKFDDKSMLCRRADLVDCGSRS